MNIDKSEGSLDKIFLDINTYYIESWPWWYYNYQNL
jgi:hypothetical protein